MTKSAKVTKKREKSRKRRKKSMPKNINWVLTCSICDHKQSIAGEGNYTCPCGAKYSVGALLTGSGGWQLCIVLMNEDEIISDKKEMACNS